MPILKRMTRSTCSKCCARTTCARRMPGAAPNGRHTTCAEKRPAPRDHHRRPATGRPVGQRPPPETIFSWPGMGLWTYRHPQPGLPHRARRRPRQRHVYVVVNLLVDISYATSTAHSLSGGNRKKDCRVPWVQPPTHKSPHSRDNGPRPIAPDERCLAACQAGTARRPGDHHHHLDRRFGACCLPPDPYRLEPGGIAHESVAATPFGTDRLGRDMRAHRPRRASRC